MNNASITNKLSEIIVQKIRENGPVSFHDFMEMCLYYPGLGYYTSLQEKIGVNGDYYTSAYLTPVYGAMIGKQIEEMWQILGRGAFTIVEYGAGQGLLSRDIMAYLQNNQELYESLRYCIIEKSPSMRAAEKTLLHKKVNWYDSIAEIGEVTGCILSNELVDNFSIHQVVMEAQLMELFVDYKDGFVETLQPADAALKEYFHEIQVVLPSGFRTEVNLEAIEWLRDIAIALKRGFILTIDYGYLSPELYAWQRRSGTLLCYHNHRVNDNPYRYIGQQDITAHVNFSALSHWGALYGMECCGFTDQGLFLRGVGLAEYLRDREQNSNMLPGNDAKNSFLLQTLLFDMGSKLKVLIQQKGVQQPMLSGFRFQLSPSL